jgi:hypothetical protein
VTLNKKIAGIEDLNAEPDELTQIRRKMVLVPLLGAPGTLLVGLSLYGLFAANGDAFLPLLNEPQNCYLMLALGAAIAVWEMVSVIRLSRRRQQLRASNN